MKSLKKYLLSIVALFVLIIALYFLSTPDAGISILKFFYNIFLFASIVAVLPFFINKKLKLENIISEVVIALFYSFTNTILAYIAYHSANNPYDITSGCFIFTLLILTKWLLRRYLPFALAHLIVYCMQIILISIPLLNITYFTLYGKPITTKGMIAIQQTNIAEATEFLLNLPSLYYLMPLITVLLLLWLTHKEHQLEKPYYFLNNLSLPKISVIIIGMPILLLSSILLIFLRTNVIGTAFQVSNYFVSISDFNKRQDSLLNSLHLAKKNGLKKPHAIILVIGESATRDYMHAFSPSSDNTTPWLSKNKDKFFLFPHAYACAQSTIVSLQHALTEANYYNRQKLNDSISIIDIAKKSGYKTYWFSNQSKVGFYDTPVTQIAERCDKAIWHSKANSYDGELLQYLQQISPQENSFVVLHLMGSHAFYNNRYPTEFQIWSNPNLKGGLDDYKNSIAYTDRVLEECFNNAKQHLNLASFVYFSDHGTDPTIFRDPDAKEFVNLRIPMFIYLSSDYQQANPQIVDAINQNHLKAFSNDLLYNLMCSIINIQSERFNESESIASHKYLYDANNVKTDFGEKNVKEDSDY